jgi:hypothetical protein
MALAERSSESARMFLIVTAILLWVAVSFIVGLGIGGLIWLYRERAAGQGREGTGAADEPAPAGQEQPAQASTRVPHQRTSQDEPVLDGTSAHS